MAYFFLFRLPNAEITVPAEPAVPLVARDICKDDWIVCERFISNNQRYIGEITYPLDIPLAFSVRCILTLGTLPQLLLRL